MLESVTSVHVTLVETGRNNKFIQYVMYSFTGAAFAVQSQVSYIAVRIP